MNDAYEELLYSACWEDADILLEALSPAPEDSVLSVGSGGDNSFSLLSKNPKRLIVADVNLVQLHLIELKKVAFQLLEYQDLKKFLGFEPDENRIHTFHSFISHLSPEAVKYWVKHKNKIDQGIIHIGKMERYFSMYRRFILPLFARKKKVKYFFEGEKTQLEIEAYRVQLSSVFFKWIYGLFFSRFVISRLGRKREFFDQTDEPVGKFLRERISTFILDPKSYQNYFVHYISLGYFPETLPHYIRQENYQAIRSNLNKLELRNESASKVLLEDPDISAINGSDIFEYFTKNKFEEFAKLLVDSSAVKKIVYWNFLVDRKLSNVSSSINYQETKSKALSSKDKLFFYKRFIVEHIHDS